MWGQLRPLKFSSTTCEYCSWRGPGSPWIVSRKNVAVTCAATAFGPLAAPVRKAVFAVPPPGSGASRVDTCSLVVASICWPAIAERRTLLGVIDHCLGDAGQPGAGGPEVAGRGQGLLREVDPGGRLADREGLDADVREGGGRSRRAGGALSQNRRAVREGCQTGHGGALSGVAGRRDCRPQARLDVQPRAPARIGDPLQVGHAEHVHVVLQQPAVGYRPADDVEFELLARHVELEETILPRR